MSGQALTTLPPEEAARRLRMMQAVRVTIDPDRLQMDTWFFVRGPEEVEGMQTALRYDKPDEAIHLCGTAACFGGHLALRQEFQDLGLGFDIGGTISVPATTPLPDGRICRRIDRDAETVPMLWPELAWFFGIAEAEAVNLFDRESYLHTDRDKGDSVSPEESLANLGEYLTSLIAEYEALIA